LGGKITFFTECISFFKGAEIIKLIIIRGKINLYMTKKRGKPIQFFKKFLWLLEKMQEIKRGEKTLVLVGCKGCVNFSRHCDFLPGRKKI